MAYDVGLITRTLQAEFRLFNRNPNQQTTNDATPEALSVLLDSLSKLTDQIEAKRDTAALDWTPDAGVVMWDRDMKAWKERLAAYKAAVAAAPAGDRGAVLWSVTAPLLLGFYGGADSDLPQQPLDAVTPFSLSNQLDVAEAWRQERWRLFKQDLEDGLKNLPTLIPWWVWAALGAGAVLTVGSLTFSVYSSRRRNPHDEEPQSRLPRSRRARAIARGRAA